MDPHRFFSEADREAVRQATADAEGRTSGEIVPVAVGACDDYDEASWKAAAMGALLTSLITGLVHYFSGFWGGAGIVWITLPAAGGAAAGFLAGRWIPAFRRAVISKETIDTRVQRRAHQAFLEEEVFATRDRTGILIFLALFERRVVVLGDSGINRAVDPSEWQAVVTRLVTGIRSGRPGPALVEAIADCGCLLEERGVTIRPDDIDELADGLRLEDR